MPRRLVKTESRKCERCGKKMVRKSRESVDRWPLRKFCSHKCAHESQVYVKPKRCPQCGKKFNKNRSRGTFCSRQCFGLSRVVKIPKRRRYLKIGRELAHRVIMSEILKRPLAKWESVHHKNGNQQDNDPKNLELWIRPQPCGQRISDLIDFIVENYRDMVNSRVSRK